MRFSSSARWSRSRKSTLISSEVLGSTRVATTIRPTYTSTRAASDRAGRADFEENWMNEHLRDRILRKVEALSDDRGYQVLDYVEFLESRYAERQSPTANTFTRFTDAIEDKLRAGKVSASTIAETVSFMNRAANVLNSAVETGKNMANELVNTARPNPPQPGPPPSTPSSASSTAHETKDPGGSGEKL